MIATSFCLLLIILTDIGGLTVRESSSKVMVKRETQTSCDDGWYLFDDMCYRNGGVRLKWEHASERCKYLGGSLASIHSQELSDFLRAFILMNIQDDMWIGLNDRDNESVYAWDDGTTLDFENWGPKRATMFNPPKGSCGEIVFNYERRNGMPGQWNKLSCEFQKESICQKKGKKQTGNSADPRFCPDGGRKLGTSCYHVVEKKLNWQDSEDYCIKVFKGHLVTINDFQITIFLEYALRNYTDDMWIGLKHKNEESPKWSSGWYVFYTNWMVGSYSSQNEMCAFRSASEKWKKTSCKSQLPFICEVSTVFSYKTSTEATTTSNSFSSNKTSKKATTTASSIFTNKTRSKDITTSSSNGFSTKIFVGVICCGLCVIILQVIAIFYFRDRSKRHV